MHIQNFIRPKPRALRKALTAASLLFLLGTASAFASIWYLAPNGSDTNSGAIDSPFLRIMRAQSAASSGDTVYLRGGTYFLNTSDITVTSSVWCIVNNITKSEISYLAYPGEDPVFNFTNVKPSGFRVTAFLVNASDCVFQGFEVVGVQVTIQTNHTQSECFRITGGNHNTFERLSMHDGMANGWYLTDGSSNLVLNCDSYNNAGLDSGSLGNTDGFGCHPAHTSGKGNVFRGCRSWFNSDDGYDCINAYASVTFDHCWSFFNGYYTNFTSTGGDANGFKVGGFGCSGGSSPASIPVHTVTFCVSARNRSHGFYANHQLGQAANWYNNTSYNNVSADFDMLEGIDSTSTNCSVAGTREVMHNNLAYVGTLTADLNESGSNVSYNSWTLPVAVTGADFASVDPAQMTQSRKADGSLPDIAFMHLLSGSDLIDAGTNIGFAFNGSAPDLGAFESLTPFQAWQTNYFGSTNNPAAAPDADPLGKGMSNTNQFLAGLNPTNPASALRIISAVQQGNDVLITWTTAGPRTNMVQATSGDTNGGYSNSFADIGNPIIIPVVGDTTTNYTDAGGATNGPSRYYRIRLAP